MGNAPIVVLMQNMFLRKLLCNDSISFESLDGRWIYLLFMNKYLKFLGSKPEVRQFITAYIDKAVIFALAKYMKC